MDGHQAIAQLDLDPGTTAISAVVLRFAGRGPFSLDLLVYLPQTCHDVILFLSVNRIGRHACPAWVGRELSRWRG